jgi:CheY-like chemotaxis protein
MARILVVEDEPSVAAVVRYHLENAGYEGHFVAEVESAWDSLVAEVPAAAVVDIKLPGASGWTLLERLRKDPRFRQIPVVVLTGLLESSTVDRAHALGCEYLSKPFAASALIHKIKGLVQSGPTPKLDTAGRPVLDLVAIPVLVLMDDYQLEGKAHVAPELERFSDAWESLMKDSRGFFPLTDVRINDREGKVVASTAFAEVSKASVRAVWPVDIGID